MSLLADINLTRLLQVLEISRCVNIYLNHTLIFSFNLHLSFLNDLDFDLFNRLLLLHFSLGLVLFNFNLWLNLFNKNLLLLSLLLFNLTLIFSLCCLLNLLTNLLNNLLNYYRLSLCDSSIL